MGNASNVGSPSRPSLFRCISPGPTTLLLEWEVPDLKDDPVTHCEIQVGSALGWSDATFVQTEEPQRHTSVFSSTHWRAKIANLSVETEYEMRVRGCNKAGDGEWFRHLFKTSVRPDAPISLKSIAKRPDAIDLEWQVVDPEGAPVDNCDVQVSGALSWGSAAFGDSESIGKPARWKGDTWRAQIVGLQGDATYEVRVRGSNIVSAGEWLHLYVKTSSHPPAPDGVRCRRRLADGLVIEWTLVDPDGAEVLACDVEIAGALSWYPAALLAEPRRFKDSWHVSLVDLNGATSYDVRVRGSNAVGKGPWSQNSFETAGLPLQPVHLKCTHRLPSELALRWTVMIPEGAAILGCEVEIIKHRSWVTATAPDCQPLLLNDTCEGDSATADWSARIVGLEGAMQYETRVRAYNAVGAGPWCQGPFNTAWTPLAPVEFTCVRRLPQKLVLEWKIEDPEGAAVTDCELEISGTLNWAECVFEADGKPQQSKEGIWSATLADLLPDTIHQIRLRGLNVCGPGPWFPNFFTTSEKPGPPAGLNCARSQADRLDLEWEVQDPDGAPITSCEVQVYGTVFWAEATYEELAKPRFLRDGFWGATVVGLAIDTCFEFRVRCENACGISPWSDASICNTQGKPDKPYALQCSRTSDQNVLLQWRVSDPDGAPVIDVRVEILVESLIASPYYALPSFAQDGTPRRAQDDNWSATLASASVSKVRLRATNLAGVGPWLRQEIMPEMLSSEEAK